MRSARREAVLNRMPAEPAIKKWAWLGLSGVVWLGLVAAGLSWMFRYQTAAGTTAEPPEVWPPHSAMELASPEATLLMMVHPQCPCTRASIAELALLMTSCQGRVRAYVLFCKPDNAPEGWEKTDLWANAARIPGVQAWCDESGAEARRFGASTSGQTLVYDRAGRLRFSGGITAGRGHSGQNPGRSAIEDLLLRGAYSHRRTDVYGCALF